MTRSPVTPALREAILHRDRGCVLFKLDPDHQCRDVWGTPHSPHDLGRLTLDHVQDGYGRMGRRAPSDAGHLVTLCAGSHLGGWATAHRPDLRAYLERVNA